MDNIKIFGLSGSESYVDSMIPYFRNVLTIDKRTQHTIKYFADGECYIKSNENVRDADVYVVSSLYTDSKRSVNDKLVELLFFIGSLRDASAKNVSLVMPYFGFARQDRKTESRAPITTKYIAQALESVGVSRVMTIDVHSLAAFQNSFRIPVDNLDSTRLFVDYLTNVPSFPRAIRDHYHHRDQKFIDADLAILSPDIGGLSRCGLLQKALSKRIGEIRQRMPVEIPLAIFDKRRINGEVVGSRIIGDVKGKRVLIFDDLIASGTTIAKAAKAVLEAGGYIERICATHGQFTADSIDNLGELSRELVVTDTIQSKVGPYMSNVINTASFVAEAIRRTHSGGSISELLEC